MRALVTVVVVLSACKGLRAEPAGAGGGAERTTAPPAVVEVLYERGLKNGWRDYGWANHGPEDGGAARLDLTNRAGWILAKPGLEASFGGVVVRYAAPAGYGDFLALRLDGEQSGELPGVTAGASHRRSLPGGVTELYVTMAELNAARMPWDKLRLRAMRSLPAGYVEFLFVGLTGVDEAEEQRLAAAKASVPARSGAFTVDCKAPTRPISPLIYGVGVNREQQGDGLWELGVTARRWGGNPTSRYNWFAGNAWNTASDWYFRNVALTDLDGPFSWQRLLARNLQHRVATALTVPTLGWVAKDTSSAGFPVALDGPQESAEDGKFGNGVGRDGKPLPSGPPTRTSVAAPPEFIGNWVKAIRARDGKGPRSVAMYILDNEPGLWHDTHRDVHPEPMTYDELLDRTLRYGAAVRAADPDAVIAGPASWGWPEYFYSSADMQAGHRLRPDRRAHGDVPLLEWWLRKLAEHEKKTGERLLDVLDVHYYPQAKGLGVGPKGRLDPESNALRIRSTRALWDPTYVDESWIGEPIQLIPRMREWVEKNYPGRKLAIGEYNFGAEQHPSGGLALAEALGRFGEQGLDAAFYWTIPPKHSPAWWAFRAYRNYDGAGAQFLDQSVPAKAPADASAFAARDAGSGKLTLVLLNFSPEQPLDGTVTLEGCGAEQARRVFTWTARANGLEPVKSEAAAPLRLPPYSISVVELTLAPKAK